MMAHRPRRRTGPILITTAALAYRPNLLASVRRERTGHDVLIVAPRDRPGVTARLRRLAQAFAARRPTTLVTV